MTRLRPELLKDHSSSAGETAEVRPRWHRTAGVMMLSAALLSGCSQGGAAPAGPHAPVSAAEVHRLQQLAESCPADAAKLTQYIGIDLSSSAQDAAIEADPRVGGRLALWGRRLMGEALRQAQTLVAERDALSAVLVGGIETPGLDLTAISRMFTRITEAHTERMARLGLAA